MNDFEAKYGSHYGLGDIDARDLFWWNGNRYTGKELYEEGIDLVKQMDLGKLINLILDKVDPEDFKKELVEFLKADFTARELLEMIEIDYEEIDTDE